MDFIAAEEGTLQDDSTGDRRRERGLYDELHRGTGVERGDSMGTLQEERLRERVLIRGATEAL